MTTTLTHTTAASFGLPQVSTEDRDAHLKAIASAEPETLLEALSVHGPVIYKDPTAAAEQAATWQEQADELKASAQRMRRTAVFIIRNARKVNPKIDLLSIGLAVEDIDRETADDAVIGGVKQRWSRFGLAIDLVAESRAAAKDGKRSQALTEDQALAISNEKAGVGRNRLREMARAGVTPPATKAEAAALASKDEPKDSDDVANARTYSPSALLNALNTATDRAKHLKVDKVTAQDVTNLRKAYDALSAAMGNVKVAPSETPVPDAEQRKSVPTPKDVAPKA